jgi:hypothetical protein
VESLAPEAGVSFATPNYKVEVAGSSGMAGRTRWRSTAMVVMSVLIGMGAVPTARADQPTAGEVLGYVASGPCVPVSYDPVTAQAECHGQAKWLGWAGGPGTYHATGVVDALTGDATGTITEHIRGHFGGLGFGELYLTGTFEIDHAHGVLPRPAH